MTHAVRYHYSCVPTNPGRGVGAGEPLAAGLRVHVVAGAAARAAAPQVTRLHRCRARALPLALVCKLYHICTYSEVDS